MAIPTRPQAPWHWLHLVLLLALPLVATLALTLAWPSMPILLGWLVLVLLACHWGEHRWPYRPDWQPGPDAYRRDAWAFSWGMLVEGLADLLIIGSLLAWSSGGLLSHWNLGLQCLIGVLAAELGSWLQHALSHREGWWWRTHVWHHLPTQVHASNGLLAHPFNVLAQKLARALPLWWLGVDSAALMVLGLFFILQGIVVHANVRGRMGILNRIVGTAELHRMHHSTRLDQAGNFGTALPIWDQLFGTWRAPVAVHEVGVADPQRYHDAMDLRMGLCAPLPWRCRASCTPQPPTPPHPLAEARAGPSQAT